MAISITTWFCVLSLAAWLVAAQSAASKAYTPVTGACPNGFTLVRDAGSPGNQSLSSAEAAYVQARRSQVISQAWKTYLANVEATNVTLPSYVSSILNGSSSEIPNLGIATSGGGYRSAIFGAGMLNALDGRNASSTSAGTGGLLQGATYLTTLSGGSWMLTSLIQANFPTIQNLVFGNSDSADPNDSWGGWNAANNLFAPSSNPITLTEYVTNLVQELQGKYDAGFPVTLMDFEARNLARHFLNGTTLSNFFDDSTLHGAGILLSSIADTELFASNAIPFPIILSDLIAPGQNTTGVDPANFIGAPLTNPIFEFNPYEMGSFDPMLAAFAPTKFLGTTNETTCITSYDQLSLVAATSSDVFNLMNLTNALTSTVGSVISAINSLLPSHESGIELDLAVFPNPFHGVAQDTFIASQQKYLTLADGGEDGEILALQPLLVKARGVDTVVAIDANGDYNNFAVGSSLIATQNRTQLLPSAYSFPSVPTSVGEFIAQNLSTRPTFFGCNVTSTNETTPLVIYIANGGPPRNGEAPVTNTSFLQIAYSSSELQAMLDQTFVIATQGHPANSSMTTDPEWPACLACAVVDRARARAGESRSGVCETCFARYCWDESTLGANKKSSGKTVHNSHASWLSTLAVAVGVLVLI